MHSFIFPASRGQSRNRLPAHSASSVSSCEEPEQSRSPRLVGIGLVLSIGAAGL